MSDALPLAHRTAIVTGGSRGIGLAIARALLGAGAEVTIAARKQPALDKAREALVGFGDSLLAVSANVGVPEDRERLVAETVARFGRLDILVNNAAANPVYGKVEDTEPWAFDKIMAVNLAAPFELAKLTLPHLEAHDAGHVINVSSIGGIKPEPGLGIYSVSKAALNSLTKVMAREWGPRGVHVNAICPGLIKTDFSEALWSDERTTKHMMRNTPLQRIGVPEDIGAAVLSLVTAGGSYMTGHILVADGGYTA